LTAAAFAAFSAAGKPTDSGISLQCVSCCLLLLLFSPPNPAAAAGAAAAAAAAGKPTDSGISLQAVRELGPDFPLFGVCMGHQCIGEAFGGALHTVTNMLQKQVTLLQDYVLVQTVLLSSASVTR
jgi:hypothetical protein